MFLFFVLLFFDPLKNIHVFYFFVEKQDENVYVFISFNIN